MEQVDDDQMESICRFSDVAEDLKVEIIKYLSFEERISCERINHEMSRVVNCVFRNQKNFVSSYGPFEYESWDTKCGHKAHAASKSDVFSDKHGYTQHVNRNSWKVIKRCPNLKSIKWYSNSVTTMFGSELYELNPNIEHLEFRDAQTFYAASDYLESPLGVQKDNRITCLSIGSDDHEADDIEDFEDRYFEFLQKCSKLDTFINYSIFNTPHVMELLAPRLKDLRVGSFHDMNSCLKIIIEKGVNITKLSIREKIKDRKLLLDLTLMPKLQSLDVSFDLDHMDDFMDRVSQKTVALTEISIDPEISSYLKQETKDFLKKCGSPLRKLHLLGFDCDLKYMRDWPVYTPLLTNLGIFCRYPDTRLSSDAAEGLVGFHPLKRLYLMNMKITDGNFRVILNGLLHLREIHLIRVKMTSKMKQDILKYAERHERRQIAVYVDYSLGLNQYPDTKPLTSHEPQDMSERYPPNLTILYHH